MSGNRRTRRAGVRVERNPGDRTSDLARWMHQWDRHMRRYQARRRAVIAAEAALIVDEGRILPGAVAGLRRILVHVVAKARGCRVTNWPSCDDRNSGGGA